MSYLVTSENEKRAQERLGHASVFILLSQVTWERGDQHEVCQLLMRYPKPWKSLDPAAFTPVQGETFQFLLLKSPIYCLWQNYQS